ncbi:HPP family protein [Thiomicrorhabdus sp. zzn3]|uniref:HPP family protein n=1 Tax=Thiomicrorhabdus sp. zzn3 TaxID=3039775 RepID=UPI0024372076|nr:HPP family protein [Thiomicrorhabdus sp. zzn3]MDG6777101.1 HPP family protein [Thiomicrorhabdus sp. zzn3]
MMKRTSNLYKNLLGKLLIPSPVSHTEKLVSALGGFIAILIVIILSHLFIPGHWEIVASMGASAVLLFAVPHGPLSQPWPLIGGHLFSAFIGISCVMLIDDPLLAASSAVGLSIGIMYYFHCLHPPGGATALTAVIGGEQVHGLGYQFLLTPVLLNIIVILGVAILFNALFEWRRYPAFMRAPARATAKVDAPFSHADFLSALKEIDSFVDIHEHDLRRIFELANLHRTPSHLQPEQIQLGKVYSNGEIGPNWSMRQIIDECHDPNPDKDYVIFKQIAGRAPKKSDCVTRSEFAEWARYEMVLKQGTWVRKHSDKD